MTWNHLWYLAYLWSYILVLALIAKPFESSRGRRLQAVFTRLRGPALMILPALAGKRSCSKARGRRT